ncbi:MAG: bifunctional UDP-N-acetylmuramoyl-tripeptide:D-alanyl-D-alanine ligase/alanine racemase [Bacteroidales bacterium]|nr:bifunctional UDP-N-acetylmuramoyl-tripeptide:D-alanyl-D-alanine ligase/alanine racemase [Bacteroidales bacterium]
MKYTLGEIAEITQGKLNGQSDEVVREVLTDSRLQPSTTSCLFIALKGMNHDGHSFIREMSKKGIRSFLVQSIPADAADVAGPSFVIVPDTLKALQQLAAHYRQQFRGNVTGITGSNGKTIVKEWLHHLFSLKYNTVSSPRSYNSQVGVPLSVLMSEPDAEVYLFEAGISFPGEMERLEKIIRPRTGIITNIGEAHQENFSDVRQKVREKLQLFRHADRLFYCADQKVVRKAVDELFPGEKPEKICWSTGTESCRLHVKTIRRVGGRTHIAGIWKDRAVRIAIPFTDQASIENAIHCWLVMLESGYEPGELQELFQALPPVAMRMEVKKGIRHCTLINDSYSSDLVSLSIALDFLRRQDQHPGKTVILSDILQSGRTEGELYRRVASLLKSKNVTRLIGIGEVISRNRDVFSLPASFYPSTDAFLQSAERMSFSDEAILLKGARVFNFERIAALLEETRHITRLEINLNALIHNFNYFKSLVPPETKLMVMVKALSYGSGSHEIAQLMQYHKADYLAVAFIDEGVALRQAGITLPVMVMSPEEQGFRLMVQHKLEPEIYSWPFLRKIIAWLQMEGITRYPVHIKIDTGMHRLGFAPEDAGELAVFLSQQNTIRVVSVFSHLAGSEDSGLDEFTRWQIGTFRQAAEILQAGLPYPFLRHILNSAGIERFPEASFEMVRLGIGLYGISAVHPEKLQQISTFKSVVSQIRNIRAGETVGYNRRGKVESDSTIAVIPVGYADGLDRRLGNGTGQFWVNGHFAPVIGNICMDMCMIDVTGIPVAEGDEVILFGGPVPVTAMAEKLNTIPYEVLTGISSRVKRVYYYE